MSSLYSFSLSNFYHSREICMISQLLLPPLDFRGLIQAQRGGVSGLMLVTVAISHDIKINCFQLTLGGKSLQGKLFVYMYINAECKSEWN